MKPVQLGALGTVRPMEGVREMAGILTDWNKERIVLETENGNAEIPFSALAFVKLYFEFE